MEQDAHIEGALAAEASLVVLDTLESVVQADGGGGIHRFSSLHLNIIDYNLEYIYVIYPTLFRCGGRSGVKSIIKSVG